jgi:hypothetical protein
MKIIVRTAALGLALVAFAALCPAQTYNCFGSGCSSGGSSGGGTAVPNPVNNACAGTSTSCAVDVHTLGLTVLDPGLYKCESYVTASGVQSIRTPMTLLSATPTGTAPITTATFAYSAPGPGQDKSTLHKP